MKKDNLKSIVVLGSICLVVAVLLSLVNYITAPIIKENAASNANASLKIVLPDANDFEKVELYDGAPATVTGVYKDTGGSGYAVTLSTTSNYSQNPLTFTLGIGTDGKIVAVEVTNYSETKDFGDYPTKFIGADSALGGVDVHAGATYSSNAFKSAVSDAFTVLLQIGGVAEGQKSEEQIIEELKAKALPGAVTESGTVMLKEMTVSADGVVEAYSAENNVGFVFVCEAAGNKIVAAVSTTGGAICYDLEENDVTADNAALVETLRGLCDTADIVKKDTATVEKAAGVGAVVTPVTIDGQFGTVSSVFTIDGAEKLYAFVATPFGYRDPMKFVYIINEAGEIVTFKSASEMIQESDYYTNYTLDESAYKEGIQGKTEGTLTDDVTAISGATMTSDAVRRAAKDAFTAFSAVKGAGK